MKRKHIPFDASEVIKKAQLEIICALLRDLPQDGTPVIVHKMFRFLNTDSYLPDGYVVESIRLVNDYHDVEVTCRGVNYEYLDNTIHDVSEVDEDNNTHFLNENTDTFILKPSPDDRDILPLLKLIYENILSRQSKLLIKTASANELTPKESRNLTGKILPTNNFQRLTRTTTAAGRSTPGTSL